MSNYEIEDLAPTDLDDLYDTCRRVELFLPETDDADIIAHAHTEIEALREEVSKLRKSLEWQPMQTAPKDGSHILGKPEFNGCACIIHWDNLDDCWNSENKDVPYIKFTGWRPIEPATTEGGTE